ncbi:MAG: hypothetical protein INR71_03190 [Terriglobus roseus]|nr:hypothetical protein [Terriglobus roseus]
MDGSEGGIRTLGAVMSPTLSTHSDTSAGTAVAAAQALLARSDGTSGPGVFGVTNEDSRAADALAGGAGMNGDGAASGSSIGPNPSHNPLFSAAAASTSSPLNSFAPPASRASSAFLPAAATWDLIQAHPLVKRGVVDIADVCEALSGTARCDGQGPVFREEMVWRAVESARRGGGDELI